MGVSTGDLLQIINRQEYLEQEILNVYYYRYTSAPSPDNAIYEELVDDWWDTFSPALLGWQSDQLVHRAVTIKNMSNAVDFFELPLSSAGGGASGVAVALPSYVSMSFQLFRDSLVTRSGSKRYAGLTEGLVSGNEFVGAPSVPAGIVDVLNNPLHAGILEVAFPIIPKRPIPVPAGGSYVYSSVTGAAFKGVGTQNTRKQGYGSQQYTVYDSPPTISYTVWDCTTSATCGMIIHVALVVSWSTRKQRQTSETPTLEEVKAMDQYEAACILLHTLRHNVDQVNFRKNFQVNGVFPNSMVHGALWRLEEAAYIMAGKTPTKYSDNWKTEFVNRNLTAEEGDDFKSWAKKENERIPDLLGQIMVQGYKVSCTWNDNNQCYIATFTGKEESKFNVNKALSSRSDDWFEALAMNAYKHLIIMDSRNWEGDTTKNNWG